MEDVIKPTMDKVLAHILEAVLEFETNNPPEKIKASVHIQLDKKREEIVLKLLGFSDSWGRWEVDHCNGRGGNSAAGDYLRTVQQEAIKEWFADLQLKTLLTPALKAKINKEMQNEFNYEVVQTARRMASNYAKKYAEAAVNMVCKSEDLPKTLTMLKTIQ